MRQQGSFLLGHWECGYDDNAGSDSNENKNKQHSKNNYHALARKIYLNLRRLLALRRLVVRASLRACRPTKQIPGHTHRTTNHTVGFLHCPWRVSAAPGITTSTAAPPSPVRASATTASTRVSSNRKSPGCVVTEGERRNSTHCTTSRYQNKIQTRGALYEA